MGTLILIVGGTIPWDGVLDQIKRKASLTGTFISLCYLTVVAMGLTPSCFCCHASATTMNSAHKLLTP